MRICVYRTYVFFATRHAGVRVSRVPVCTCVYVCVCVCRLVDVFDVHVSKQVARSSIFLVHIILLRVYSRVIANRLEKLNIPCIHIYASIYMCMYTIKRNTMLILCAPKCIPFFTFPFFPPVSPSFPPPSVTTFSSFSTFSPSFPPPSTPPLPPFLRISR